MKRRQAIRNIAIATAAAYLLPGCKGEPVATDAAASGKLSLDAEQRKLLDQLTEALLPKAKTEVKTPETTSDFLLAVLNDCHSPEDASKYLGGLKELQSHVAKQYKTDFGALSAAQQAEVFTWLSKPEGQSEPLKFFAETTRGLTIEHFTSSEFFLKNVRNWAFAPGYFKGCVAV
jgi:Gluconate 2-dehydrogenase subunit 3